MIGTLNTAMLLESIHFCPQPKRKKKNAEEYCEKNAMQFSKIKIILIFNFNFGSLVFVSHFSVGLGYVFLF